MSILKQRLVFILLATAVLLGGLFFLARSNASEEGHCSEEPGETCLCECCVVPAVLSTGRILVIPHVVGTHWSHEPASLIRLLISDILRPPIG